MLILGCGEIARYCVKLSHLLNYSVTVCASDAGQHRWPNGVTQRIHNFTSRPWSLPENTHAIIAQGHENDPRSLSALLNHRATHVYLIASAKRAKEVIQFARPHTKMPDLLNERLSSPAGLNLGGQSSGDIALSVLAEIQWRHHNQNASVPLVDPTRQQRPKLSSATTSLNCPGKRP